MADNSIVTCQNRFFAWLKDFFYKYSDLCAFDEYID